MPEYAKNRIGPMIAHTTHKSIRIWMRAGDVEQNDSRSIVARLYHQADNNDYIEQQAFDFLADYDHIGLIEFGNGSLLEEDKAYDYRVGYLDDSDGFSEIAYGIVKTFPIAKDKPVSFITGSCRHLYVRKDDPEFTGVSSVTDDTQYGDIPFQKIIEDTQHHGKPDLMVMTGDQVYADHEEGSIFPFNPAQSLAEYYDNYHRAYQQKYFSALGAQCPMFMSMDDHEIKNDWHMDMILEHDENWYGDCAKFQGEWQEENSPAAFNDHIENLKHYQNGLKAYLVYQASLSAVIKDVHNLKAELDTLADVADEKAINSTEIPYKQTTKGLHYEYSYGCSKFFSLDVRAERYMRESSPQMIGEAQLDSLLKWLLVNRSDDFVKFVVSAVPMFPDTKNVWFYPVGAPQDKWAAYAEQRKRILDFIRENNIRKVVFLSGDVHVSLFAKLYYVEGGVSQDLGVYSVISSGFRWPVPGLQRFNFDWRNLPEKTKYKHCKRVPDTSKASRGNYQPQMLSKWKWFKTGHREDNYCRVETNGQTLTVRYYRSRSGECFEEKEISF